MAGYNHVLPSRVLVGGELDASFPNFLEGDDLIATRRTPLGVVTDNVDDTASLRRRFLLRDLAGLLPLQ